jgi:hypothetical protein
MIFEELRWLNQIEFTEPSVNHGVNCRSVKGLYLFLV